MYLEMVIYINKVVYLMPGNIMAAFVYGNFCVK